MSSPKGKRDIVRLRTFADDVERAQKDKGVSDQVVAAVLPQDKPQESQGVFHKVQKKSLDLKDTSNQPSAIDTDGITFDEEMAQQVTDQAYEEQKSVQDDNANSAPNVSITPGGNEINSKPETAQPVVQTPISPLEVTNPRVISPQTKPVEIKVDDIANAVDTNFDEDDTSSELSEEGVGRGEIVSDKKRERFKLFPAIGQAMTDWFTETKEQIEESQREKYTVSKVEDRVDTIRAAAQAKTSVPEEDYSQVAKRLKEAKKVKTDSAPVIIAPKKQETGSWTHTTDETESVQTQPVTPPAPQPAAVQTQTQTMAAAATSQPVVREIQNANISPQDIANLANPQPATPLAPTGVAQTLPRDESKGFTLPKVSVPGKELLPSPALAIAVVVLAIISGIGTSLYFFWQPAPETVVPQATTSPLFTAELQTNIEFSGIHSETMNTLLSAINSNPGSLYMYFTRNAGLEVVPPTEVVSFLAPQAPGSFTRSITNVSFGAYDNRPFIVLRVNNFDNAFSGMLAWEQTMSADLAPLFGPVVTESFDPQARTDSRTRSAFFQDIVASNLSGRLLADERGEDRILYTFVDKQTVVITTDRLQLSNILPLIR